MVHEVDRVSCLFCCIDVVGDRAARLFHLGFGSGSGVDCARRAGNDLPVVPADLARVPVDSHPLRDSFYRRALHLRGGKNEVGVPSATGKSVAPNRSCGLCPRPSQSFLLADDIQRLARFNRQADRSLISVVPAL